MTDSQKTPEEILEEQNRIAEEIKTSAEKMGNSKVVREPQGAHPTAAVTGVMDGPTKEEVDEVLENHYRIRYKLRHCY